MHNEKQHHLTLGNRVSSFLGGLLDCFVVPSDFDIVHSRYYGLSLGALRFLGVVDFWNEGLAFKFLS